MIDLRSDTVTRPSAAMRQAMAAAEVGDDVYGEDPTVNALERETARLLGKAAAVFVTSGTQANQCALLAATSSGDEIWVHEAAHLVVDEQGGAAVLARVALRTFAGAGGLLAIADLRRWLRPDADDHNAPIRLLWLENTVGISGAPLPLDYLAEVAAFAHEQHMHVHLDGARLWEASVASGASPAALARHADSVSVCFSKGLGAPVGSALAGSCELVARARRARKLLGGGMRQSGIVAAGALHALAHNRDRLEDSHRRARRFAAAIDGLPRLRVDPAAVATTFVIGAVADGGAPALARELVAAGVGCSALSGELLRFVVHLDIGDDQIDEAIAIVRGVLVG
jgi:threonine aldolase